MNPRVFFRYFLCLYFLFIAYNGVYSQATNPCGVTAVITPSAADSVVPFGSIIQLTSASMNAGSITWLMDGVWLGNQPDFTYYAAAGTHTISLVATGGGCSDTTTVVYFSSGQPHDIDNSFFANYGLFDTYEYGTCMDDTPDGGLVLGGYGTLVNNRFCGHQGLVVKLRDRGCVDWSKDIVDTVSYCGYGDVNKIFAAPDSSYYVSGSGFLLKLDKDGNQVWNNIYRLGSTYPYYLDPVRMAGDDAGNVYLLCRTDWGWSITRIGASGSVAWSKHYHVQLGVPGGIGSSSTYGLTYLDGKLYVTGGNIKTIGQPDYVDFLTRIDAATGKTDWQYGYRNMANPNSRSFDQVSKYGNLVMVAGTDGGGQGVFLLDADGNIRKTVKAKFNTSHAPHITKAEADANGNIYIMQWTEATLNLQPYYYYYTNFVKIDTAGNKFWGMVYPKWNFNDMAVGKTKFAAIGSDVGKEFSAFLPSVDMRFFQVNTSINDLSYYQNYNCYYYAPDFTLSTMPMNRVDFTWGVDSFLSIKQEPVTIYTVKEAHIQSRYTCPDFVDSCNMMKISGPASGCSYANTYTYRVHRNKKCALQPQWNLPKGVSIITETDSTITLKFPGFGVFGISCTLKSCTPVFDSLTLAIIPKTAPLDLGRDTVICNQTTITLNAGNNFLLYQWQDGSNQSSFTVTQPGRYWVQVTDACGNILSDSVLVQPYNSGLVDIGPDRVKCNSDTVHLEAPAGFLNYTWSNNYNISSTSSQKVVVNPLTDTAYYIKAEKLPGCFAYDTVRITVRHSPAINLGEDKSFCSGDSVTFNAGSGFVQYLWSTGAAIPQLTVKNKGSYTVTGITAEGCKSYDTVIVQNVFANPLVSIDNNPWLCTGSSRVLDAGVFSSYVWNDGSTKQKITVNTTGTYFVQVVDNNGCKGSDTMSITTLLPLPSDFLPADTVLCSYDELMLTAGRSYNSYQWNTGASSPSLKISQPGTYWLQVKDTNGCLGKDSITINPKDCMKGIYVPTAFSPNNDNKNDLFRPLLFGKVKKFELVIYNRWGQTVFKTSELNKGWDGRVAGILQDSNVFIWICTFRFEGEELKTQQGTVMLVR